MVVEISASIEKELQGLATRQGRNIDSLVEQAIRELMVNLAITDLEATEVGETQMTLMAELYRLGRR